MDDTSLTLIHTLDQDINNVDNSSDVNGSQPIDINSINLKNHVSNDCESLPIEINHISASHSHDGVIQNQDHPFADNSSDVNESQSIDINSIHLNNHVSNDRESTSGSDTIATRVRAKNTKACQKKIHEKSQHFTARKRDNTSSSESLSYEY
jgi:hypothetical protein